MLWNRLVMLEKIVSHQHDYNVSYKKTDVKKAAALICNRILRWVRLNQVRTLTTSLVKSLPKCHAILTLYIIINRL